MGLFKGKELACEWAWYQTFDKELTNDPQLNQFVDHAERTQINWYAGLKKCYHCQRIWQAIIDVGKMVSKQ